MSELAFAVIMQRLQDRACLDVCDSITAVRDQQHHYNLSHLCGKGADLWNDSEQQTAQIQSCRFCDSREK